METETEKGTFNFEDGNKIDAMMEVIYQKISKKKGGGMKGEKGDREQNIFRKESGKTGKGRV